jgi:hypothetical protein
MTQALTYAYFCWQSSCAQVENFGRMRYERSREALEHGRILTQRHEATDAELAMAEGDRRLVSGLLWVAPASNCIDCSCGIMQLLWLQWLWLQALCTHVQ